MKNCTGGNCDRRAAYLKTATELLVTDLDWMTEQWARKAKPAKKCSRIPRRGLKSVFVGLGSLSYGELAGERMKLGLLIHDPEEEHDCFSDNTFNSHHDDAKGIQNVYLGSYKRLDGSVVSGPSVSDLIKAKSPETDAAVRAAVDKTMQKMNALVERGTKRSRPMTK